MCVSLFRYSHNGHRVVDNVYGAGSGAIFMDDVDCTGSETSLADCNHRGWGSHSCVYSDDVAIECYVPTTATVGMNIVVYNVQNFRNNDYLQCTDYVNKCSGCWFINHLNT